MSETSEAVKPEFGGLTLPHLIAEVAREHPDREVLVEVDGDSRTYAEFDLDCRRWAAGLADLGVEAGDRVAVMLPTSINSFSTWLGVAWLRAVEVPANTAYRQRVLSYLLNNSGAKLLVVAERYLSRVAEIAAELVFLNTIVIVADRGVDPGGADATAQLADRFLVVQAAELLEGREPLDPSSPPRDRHLGCVMYTSGTSGPSKGVLMPWGLVRSLSLKAFPRPLPDGATVYCPLPVFHIGGKMMLYMAAVASGRLIVREAFDTNSFWDDIRKHDVHRTALVGAMPHFVFRQPERPDDHASPLQEVFMVPVIPDYRAFEARFGVNICTGFGMTEIGSVIGTPFDIPSHRTCGRVLSGFEVRVVDDDDAVVAPGEQGELIVRADEPWTLNLGYFGMDDVTADAWRNGWFHTGDLFTYDADGWFYFVDRKKDAIRRRGENVSSFEVEAEVLAHPDVAEVAAVPVPSADGEDEIKVVVVAKPESELSAEGLLEYLIPRMARFMVPRYIEFVDVLPKTPTAKVRKAELRERGVTAETYDRVAAGVSLPK